MVRKTCSLLHKKVQTRDVRGQKMPENANVICESSQYILSIFLLLVNVETIIIKTKPYILEKKKSMNLFKPIRILTLA